MPGVCPGARSTTQPRLEVARRRRAPAPAARGCRPGRVGGATAAHARPCPARRSLQRAARDPQQEQVEHGEEAELAARRRPARASTASLLDLEARARRCRARCGRRRERLRAARRASAVDQHAVGRAEVGDRPAAAARAELGVAARDVGVVEHDVALAAAADHRAAGADARSRLPSATSSARPRRARARCSSGSWQRARRRCRPSCGRGRPARAPRPRAVGRAGRAAPGCRTRRGAGARRCGTRSVGRDSSASRSRRACSSR